MNKKLIIISVVSLMVVAATIIVLINKNVLLSPAAQNPGGCNSLIYNGENGINLVFISSKNAAESYSNSLFSLSPFKENPSAFNVYYIDAYTPECEIYKGIALLCYSQEIIEKASSCPSDYIIVVKQEDSSIRSSSYMNVMSLNSAATKSVLAHEFGHALANLADEYTPAEIPRKSENCQSGCDKFANQDTCFQGCSKTDFYRSVENGIMKTLSSTSYGQFDESLLNTKMSQKTSTITGSAISEPIDCSNQNYYLIEGNYSQQNKEIKIMSRSIEQGCSGTNGAGPLNYSLILEDNSIYSGGEFNAELIFTDGQQQNEQQISGENFPSDKPFYLKIQIVENAKSLEISAPETKVSIDLTDLESMLCKVQSIENPLPSPEVSCTDPLSSAIKIESVCRNKQNNEMRAKMQRTPDSPEVSLLSFELFNNNNATKWICGGSCSSCKVLQPGETRFYYFSTDEQLANDASLAISADECLLGRKQITAAYS